MRIAKPCLAVVVVSLVVLGAPGLGAPAYASDGGRFTSADVSAFIRQAAKAGIGTYRPGARKPVVRVKGRQSPIRLTSDLARSAAQGAWAHTGMTAEQLDTLTGPVKARSTELPTGALVVAWATVAKTPGARLARKLLGPIDRARYQSVVLSDAVLMLFASDLAMQMTGKRAARAANSDAALATAAAGRPCTASRDFVEETIRRFFAGIGHIKPDRNTLNRWFGSFLGPILNRVGEILVIPVNATIDAAGNIVIGITRIPIRVITEAIAGVAGAVTVVSQITNGILPWRGFVAVDRNPTSKGVGSGISGRLTLAVTAPGSNLQWPSWLRDCASLFTFPLPTTTPKNQPVSWNLVQQTPAGLVTPLSGNGRLDNSGHAAFAFVTGAEDAKTATGTARNGTVDAVATVQRDDLDPLVRDVSNSVLRMLPQIVRSTLGEQIRAVINPLLNTVKRKILEVRNVSSRVPFTVGYHDPPDKQPEPSPPTPPHPLPPTGRTRIFIEYGSSKVTLTSATATCQSGPGTPFTLQAHEGDWSLDVTIVGWRGFPSPPELISYPVVPGGSDPFVVVKGPPGEFTSAFTPDPKGVPYLSILTGHDAAYPTNVGVGAILYRQLAPKAYEGVVVS